MQQAKEYAPKGAAKKTRSVAGVALFWGNRTALHGHRGAGAYTLMNWSR